MDGVMPQEIRSAEDLDREVPDDSETVEAPVDCVGKEYVGYALPFDVVLAARRAKVDLERRQS